MTSDAHKQQSRSDGESSGGATPARNQRRLDIELGRFEPVSMPSYSRPWSVPNVIVSGRAKA